MIKEETYEEMEPKEGKQTASDTGNTSVYNTLDENKGNVCEYNTLEDVTIFSTQVKTRSVETQTTSDLSEEISDESPVQIPNLPTKSVESLKIVSAVLVVVVVIMAGTVGFLMFKQVSNNCCS